MLLKYGVTTDYVLGLDVVLADGELITLGGKRIKDVAGLSLLKLFVGSEGTLGIITRAILRLLRHSRPGPPWWPPSPPGGGRRAVVALGMVARPSMVELMDNASINIVEDYRSMGLDRRGRCAAARAVRCGGAPRAPRRSPWPRTPASGTGRPSLQHRRPRGGRDVRRGPADFFPAVEDAALSLEDAGLRSPSCRPCSPGSPPSPRTAGSTSPVAHAGDGNTHPTIVFDPADTAARDRAALAFTEIMELAISLGGTITGSTASGGSRRSCRPPSWGRVSRS